jgi:predicted secreted protein
MGVLVGKDGSVKYKELDASGTPTGSLINVAQITSWSVSVEADTLEYTNFDSQGWKENMGSLKSWSGSLEGFELNSGSILSAGDTVELQLYDGHTTYTGKAVVTSKSVDASTAELVTVSYDFTGTGALV